MKAGRLRTARYIAVMNASKLRLRDPRCTPCAEIRPSRYLAHAGVALVAIGVNVACGSSRPAPRDQQTEHSAARHSAQASEPEQQAEPGHGSTQAEHAGHDEPGHDVTGGAHAHGSGYHMDFSDVERFARHFDGPERDAWQRPAHVIRLMGVEAGHTVADLGAGTGYFVGPLARAVGKTGRLLALDVEPKMVEYIRRRAAKSGWSNVEARVVPPGDPELAQGSVDRVLIVNTWHHIDNRQKYARRLAKALRPEGAVYIVDFTLESDIGPPREHRLSADAVVHELRGGGLQAEILQEDLPKQYIVRGDLERK